MKNPTLGVLGTGDFAAYFIAALRKGGYSARIVLSPHSPTKASAIAKKYDCEVADDESQLMADVDWILLAVRPEQLPAAMSKLNIGAHQVLISAVAGLTVATLRGAVGNSVRIVRIMPSSYIESINEGLIPTFPKCPEVESVLAMAGRVLIFDEEDQFELAMLGACLSGWMYRFVSSLEDWFWRHGLSQKQAREVVTGNMLGAAGSAQIATDLSLSDISDQIATPGTYTRLGLDHLLENEVSSPWLGALDEVYNRLLTTRS